jgi:hypothetical protein
LKYVRLILLKPAAWYGVSLVAFFICTGGLVYAIIHQVPWFKFERNEYGQVYISEYFMKGQRGQWAGEGYIVSFLTVVCGLILTLLSRIDTFFSKSMSKRIAVLVILAIVFILCQLILMCYRYKSPWYGPTFMPPHHY